MRLKPVVLSIDDDPSFSKTIELVLGRFGVNVKSVSTVEDFLENAKNLNPDLCLVDLQLKESSGIELIKKIRHELGSKIFIVVVSGTKNPESVAHALETGANDYILKPLDRVLLATKLSQFVETDEIREHSAGWKSLPMGPAPIQLQFGGAIYEVDELGVKFVSSALVPKGIVLKLGSDFFSKIGAPQKEYLVTVTSTWLIPESQKYGAYAEFDGVDPEFLQILRRWLTQPS